MGWFNRKPRDLIADSNAEWEQIRDADLVERGEDPFMTDLREVAQSNLIAAGGWCAPSDVNYGFLSLPEIQIKRGGIKWPTNP